MNITLGLPTFAALVATYEPSREFLQTESDPFERALYRARLAFIDSARVTKWKAILPLPVSPLDRAVLAEDLNAWADAPGLIAECETTRPRTAIRYAFSNIARQLLAI